MSMHSQLVITRPNTLQENVIRLHKFAITATDIDPHP
jgi:hypothetical protein